ncbi:peptidase inhibitor family I36 protein [Microbacteriaceae bacterium VKM Ac-2855]|nr:peptidase inhibitor family I36 protein [Microbacteriaceae bacterium VKM Ac-2855]
MGAAWRKAVAFAATAAVGIGVAVAAPTASASTQQCPVGWTCVWTDWKATGSFEGHGRGNYNQYYYPGGQVFNDSITSIFNRYTTNRSWYEDINQTGVSIRLSPGAFVEDLTPYQSSRWYHPSWNDFISSID